MSSQPASTTTTAENSADQVAHLQSRLEERNRVVSALTERLEAAAEQLDRVKRTGSTRILQSGSLPPGFVEEQQDMARDLKRMLESWEEAQVVDVLQRVEQSLELLPRQLAASTPFAVERDASVTDGSVADGSVADGSLADGSVTGATPDGDAINASQTAEQAEVEELPAENPHDAASQAWEKMKAGMLDEMDDEPDSPPVAQPTNVEVEAQPTTEETAATDEVDSDTSGEEAVLAEPVDPPQPVDFDNATTPELQAAIDDRDEFISYLLGRLRHAELPANRQIDLASLVNVPEELSERLHRLEAQWTEHLKYAEVDMALERARIGRKMAQLEKQEQKADKLARKAAHEAGTPEGKEQVRERRWLQFLGVGRHPHTDDDSQE